MIIICWCIFAIITIISFFTVCLHYSFIEECKTVNINTLKGLSNKDAFTSKNKYLTDEISYLLSSKKKNITVNPASVLHDINKYMNFTQNFPCYMFCIQLGLYSAAKYFGMIQHTSYLILLISSLFILVAFMLLHKILITTKTEFVEGLFKSIINEFCILPIDYSKEIYTVATRIDSKTEKMINENKNYAGISNALEKNMQSILQTIRRIGNLTKDYSDLKTAKTEENISDSIKNLKKKIDKIEGAYNEVLKDGKEKSGTVQKYIDFFTEYNGFYNEFQNVEACIVTLLDAVKSNEPETTEQLKEIKLILHAIAAKQLNEVKSIVDVFVSDVFGRISFIFENNLERTNQTLATMEKLFEQGHTTIDTIEDYNKQIQKNLCEMTSYNSKINELISNNSQLVSFVLKRHKYIDGNVFNKLGSLIVKSPIETTDTELDILKNKLENLQLAVNKLSKSK